MRWLWTTTKTAWESLRETYLDNLFTLQDNYDSPTDALFALLAEDDELLETLTTTDPANDNPFITYQAAKLNAEAKHLYYTTELRLAYEAVMANLNESYQTDSSETFVNFNNASQAAIDTYTNTNAQANADADEATEINDAIHSTSMSSTTKKEKKEPVKELPYTLLPPILTPPSEELSSGPRISEQMRQDMQKEFEKKQLARLRKELNDTDKELYRKGADALNELHEQSLKMDAEYESGFLHPNDLKDLTNGPDLILPEIIIPGSEQPALPTISFNDSHWIYYREALEKRSNTFQLQEDSLRNLKFPHNLQFKATKKNKIYQTDIFSLLSNKGNLVFQVQACLTPYHGFISVKILFKSNIETLKTENIQFVQIVKDGGWNIDGASDSYNRSPQSPVWRNNTYSVEWPGNEKGIPATGMEDKFIYMADEPGTNQQGGYWYFYTAIVLCDDTARTVEWIGYIKWEMHKTNRGFDLKVVDYGYINENVLKKFKSAFVKESSLSDFEHSIWKN